MNTHVIKIGGENASDIRTAEWLADFQSQGHQVAVAISALRTKSLNTTAELIRARDAFNKDGMSVALPILEELFRAHLDTLKAAKMHDSTLEGKMRVLFDQFFPENLAYPTDLFKGDIASAQEQRFIGYGEVMSAQVLSHLLDTQFQVANSLIDHSIRAVDEDHRNLSALLRDEVGQRVYDGLGSGIVIVPGYVGVFDNSILSEYGRGYTDKTAERVAVGLANLGHDTILHIQKQVPMYSSHPGNMPTAKVLDAISYRSAAEITGSGGANAQVLNEHTVSDDLVAHNIPVWVYNPFEKDAPRTIISAKGSNEQGVQFVDKKENISTVTISSYSMSKPGILELITNCFKELGIPIGIPSGSETAVSLTTYRALDDAEKNTLSANIKRALGGVGEVNITDTFGLIYCIGDHLEGHPGILAKITKIIAEANIDIKYASQPVGQGAVVIGVNSEDLERGTNLLHAALITQKN